MADLPRRKDLTKAAAALAFTVGVVALGTAGSAVEPVSIETEKLAEGDLIFRAGDEWISEVVRVASRGGQWSHVGLVSQGENGWEVLHAIPNGSEGKVGGVTIDTLDEFLSRSRAAGVYRAELDEESAIQTSRFVRDREAKPFGTGDDGTTNCTILILDAYDSVHTPLEVQITRISLLGQEVSAVMPADLAGSEALVRVQ